MGSRTHFHYQHSNAHSSLSSYFKLYPRTTYQVKTNRKQKAQKCSEFFVIWNCWVGICSSYGFYLHMRLLKPSNNFIQIVIMRWINQAFMLGTQSWVRLITLIYKFVSSYNKLDIPCRCLPIFCSLQLSPAAVNKKLVDMYAVYKITSKNDLNR